MKPLRYQVNPVGVEDEVHKETIAPSQIQDLPAGQFEKMGNRSENAFWVLVNVQSSEAGAENETEPDNVTDVLDMLEESSVDWEIGFCFIHCRLNPWLPKFRKRRNTSWKGDKMKNKYP